MSDVQVSLFSSAVRVEHWMKFYNQFTMNKVLWEIVFTGPVVPQYELPENLRFIHISPDPGPVKCSAIAEKFCVGECVIPTGDDVVFSPYALDYMYEEYKKHNDYKCIIHARWGFGPDSDVTDVNEESRIPGTAWRWNIGPMYSKQFYDELGGNDVRYTGGAGEGDVQIRALRSGGYYVYAKDAYVQEDMSYIGNNSLSPERAYFRWNGPADNELMRQRWFPNGVLLETPTSPFEPLIFRKLDDNK